VPSFVHYYHYIFSAWNCAGPVHTLAWGDHHVTLYPDSVPEFLPRDCKAAPDPAGQDPDLKMHLPIFLFSTLYSAGPGLLLLWMNNVPDSFCVFTVCFLGGSATKNILRRLSSTKGWGHFPPFLCTQHSGFNTGYKSPPLEHRRRVVCAQKTKLYTVGTGKGLVGC